MNLAIINGPNLNFLGIREKSVYGKEDYSYLVKLINDYCNENNLGVDIFQSNSEGQIIDYIQKCYYDKVDAIVINPGAFTHYSYAIRDALASVMMPIVEVHISDIYNREEFRKISVIKDVCVKQISGQGLKGYLMAIDYLRRDNK